jgi:predicted transcriptional regulator
MSALSVRLPESLHRKLAELAEREGISINQLVNSAVAEKMAALMTEEYLEARAERGSRRKFAAVLAKVPDIEPEETDRIVVPPGRRRRQKAG